MNRKKTLSASTPPANTPPDDRLTAVRWAVAAAMLLLLRFPALSLEGARKGLLLWYGTVLPTLLPFLIFTGLLISLKAVPLLTAPFSPLLKKGLGLSDAGAFTLLTGMLCGYPMGAKTCSDFLDRKAFSLAEGRTLFAAANFPSPMFLAGYMMAKAAEAAGPGFFSVPLWKLAAAVYLPAVPIFFLAAKVYHFSASQPACGFNTNRSPEPIHRPVLVSSPASVNSSASPSSSSPTGSPIPEESPAPTIDEILSSSAETMVKIGMYLMLFSILAEFLTALPIPGRLLPVILVAAAEMTTGMDLAARTLQGLPALFIIVGAGAFGGFSGMFQVNSVRKNAGLSIRHYLLWKTVHMLGACLIFALLWGLH